VLNTVTFAEHGGQTTQTSTVVTTFAEQDGQARVTVRMLFESAAERDRVAKKFGAIEGLNQTLTRLEEYVTSCS
jgi:uncharacterized protein YndB with AHSA1/START domain